MRIVNPFFIFQSGDKQTRKNGIKIYCTNHIHLYKKQEKKQAQIIFSIK